MSARGTSVARTYTATVRTPGGRTQAAATPVAGREQPGSIWAGFTNWNIHEAIDRRVRIDVADVDVEPAGNHKEVDRIVPTRSAVAALDDVATFSALRSDGPRSTAKLVAQQCADAAGGPASAYVEPKLRATPRRRRLAPQSTPNADQVLFHT
jgi:hypothetical protein